MTETFVPSRISVIMPCYNAAAFVEGAVNCVMNQTYPDIELIVVDDGSTDGSVDILQQFAAQNPSRITLLFQDRMGPYPARNLGLEHARGGYVAFLDADDYWTPDALEKLEVALNDHKADIAYCGWQNVGIAATDTQPKILPVLDAGEVVSRFLDHCPWPINSVLIRRHFIDELRGFSERAPTAMDYDLWLRMLAHQPRLARVPEVLAFYRRYPRGETHIPRWRQVFDAVAVRRDFAHHHPELVARLTPARLNELIYDPCCTKPIVATGTTTPNPHAACSAAPSASPTGKPATSNTSSPACSPPRSIAIWSISSPTAATPASTVEQPAPRNKEALNRPQGDRDAP